MYDGWRYPDDWVVEGFAQEGPKILRHADYYYMILAEGGTAGPATGHMVVAARVKSLDGPWENCPRNPIIRTGSAAERWWSKGHATLHLRLVNDRHIVSLFYSRDGRKWDRLDTRMDVSGYHHNVAGDFLSLRPALYAAGAGDVRFRDFTYRALSDRQRGADAPR